MLVNIGNIEDGSQTINNLLEELNNRKVKLWVDGNILRYKAPKGVLTQEMLKTIGEKKEEIVRSLRKNYILLNVDSVHDVTCDCTQDLIASLAVWRGLEYEVVFADSWGFEFTPDADRQGIIGNMIDSGINDSQRLAEDFLGIKLFNCEVKSLEQVLDTAKSELEEGRPLIIWIDSYWNPCAPNYKKSHFYYHSFMAVGIDSLNNSLIYIDPYTSPEKQLYISVDELKEGIGPIITKIRFDENVNSQLPWLDLLKDNMLKIEGKKQTPGAFNAMREFAGYFEKNIDYVKEAQEYNNFYNWLISLKIDEIVRGRRQFAKFLKALSVYHDVPDISTIIAGLETASSKWHTVHTLVMKGALLDEPDPVNTKISLRVKALADYEEEIFIQLKNSINNLDGF
ncbi:MAG: C39 family peptidase [Clostridia bacterium]|nr:C39 family peptidase [Clostridia bacterium]